MTRDSLALIAPLVFLTACRDPGNAAVPECGNGVARGAEQCDGQDLSGQTCFLAGYLDGPLSCRTDCTLDLPGRSSP